VLRRPVEPALYAAASRLNTTVSGILGRPVCAGRLMEKKRELVRQAGVDALIDGIVGVTLTHLSSMPARCAPRGDLAIRRSIERVVFEVRTEIAKLCQQMADKNGEPPLD